MTDFERKLNAFDVLIDASFGTLWWARNSLWKQEPSFVLKKGTEMDSHPGVSLQKNNVRNTHVVPMLLGTSSPLRFKRAVSFTIKDSGRKSTSFGTLRPVEFDFWSFLNGSVSINEEKRKLSEQECSALEDFIRRKLQW